MRQPRFRTAMPPPLSPRFLRNLTVHEPLPLDKPPPPPPGPAVAFHAAQVALWRRVIRGARPLAITLLAGAAWAAIAPTVGLGNGLANFLLFLLSLAGAGALAFSTVSLLRTAHYWRMLRRHEWTVYPVEDMHVFRTPLTMTLVDEEGERYPIKIRGTANTAYFLGMVFPEVWFIGDPVGDGLLTVTGGGEIMRTRATDVR